VPTALVKVPGASHGGIAARPSPIGGQGSAILAWFDKYRTKGAAAQTSRNNRANCNLFPAAASA
jgi:hypothetical protein